MNHRANKLLVAEKDPVLHERPSQIDCSDLLSMKDMLGTGDLDDDYFKDIQGVDYRAI